ncbi:MAG: (d)CMP kinase [Candidatus Omnitrophota bacterium]
MLLDNLIAIDGPCGSGKSTVAKRLALKLRYKYIDTGAMYRAYTLKAIRENLDFEKEQELIELTKHISLDIVDDGTGHIKVLLDKEDVSQHIRTPELTNRVSYIAKVPSIREWMVKNQRRIGERGNCVLEGRDIGTVVFPDAKFKFYIDAEFDERVRRRHKELIENGSDISFDALAEDMRIRDEKDKNRKVGALKVADDAIYVDTTNFGIDEVVDKLVGYIQS